MAGIGKYQGKKKNLRGSRRRPVASLRFLEPFGKRRRPWLEIVVVIVAVVVVVVEFI